MSMRLLKIILDILLKFRYNTRMKQYKKQPWTMKERRLLSEHYYMIPTEDLLLLFPQRTIGAIRNQVNYLRKRGYKFKRV
jgi:hypothetical protein